MKRLVYSYYLRDFSPASLNLLVGLMLLAFGGAFGAVHWWQSILAGVPATTGTVMVAVLPIILGFQLLMNFLAYDMSTEPRFPLQRLAEPSSRGRGGEMKTPERVPPTAPGSGDQRYTT